MQDFMISKDIEDKSRLLINSFSYRSSFYRPRKLWRLMRDNQLWEQIVLSILSSNIQFETAYSALLQLVNRELMDYNTYTETTLIRIIKELKRSIYLPRKNNNDFRSYRYPNKMANYVYDSGVIIRKRYGSLRNLLNEFDDIDELRTEIVRYLPGIGMKEASMFLRNIGFSYRVAILDRHVMRFLFPDCGFCKQKRILTPKTYLIVEKKFQSLSDKIGIYPCLLDNLIWQYSKEGIN